MKVIKKRRLKRSVWLLVLLIGIIGSLCFGFSYTLLNSKKENLIETILTYDQATLDVSFLQWVQDSYGVDALKEISNALENDTYDGDRWHDVTGNSYIVLQDLYQDEYDNRDDVTIMKDNKEFVTIGYIGDVSLADNWDIMPYYESRNQGVYGILDDNMVSYMKGLNWLIANSEFAFGTNGTPMANKLYTFLADPSHISIYREMGVDMVTLANNHVYDYGHDAFVSTLKTLRENSLPYIGAGNNIEEATSAHYLIINGYKISFLNATRAEKYIMTPGATETTEGVFRAYDPSLLVQRIKEEKQNSDYVVVLIHWGTENSHELEDVQLETGRLYIDSGADMVVGTHAHVLQGMEFYKGKLIAYNLGNFIFNDQTVDTGILTWKLYDDKHQEFFFYPGIQKDCYTSSLGEEEAQELYQKMTEWSINVSFLEDGKIVEKENSK